MTNPKKVHPVKVDKMSLLRGAQGEKGDKGERGENGLKGDVGLTGPQGDVGLRGPKGDTGPQGLTGEQGATGPQGEKGNPGAKGMQGDKGDTGLQGISGPQGPKGDKGDRGPVPDHQIDKKNGRIRFLREDGTWGAWVEIKQEILDRTVTVSGGKGALTTEAYEDIKRIYRRITGIIGDENGVDCIDFDITNISETQEGRLCWNPDEDSLAVGMPGGNVNLNIGSEQFIPRRVENKTGDTVENGSLVYISGGTGNNVSVAKARADAAATAETTIAMATEDIINNGKGYATTFGLVRGDEIQPIDTSSWTAGTVLYLDAATSGSFTDTIPIHPNYAVRIGQVFRQHAKEGAILVNIEEPVCPCRIAGGDDAVWDDLRFPFAGQSLDSPAGRIDYNYFNCAIGYQNNALYPTDRVCFLVQMPHEWLEGSDIETHMHWIQQGSAQPNWLLGYRIIKKGEQIGVQTDFSNYTLIPVDGNVFNYASGEIHQISDFATIDMTGTTISDCLQIAMWRDTTNASGEFTGSDPSSITELVLEFDIHYKIDSLGSRNEFTKG